MGLADCWPNNPQAKASPSVGLGFRVPISPHPTAKSLVPRMYDWRTSGKQGFIGYT